MVTPGRKYAPIFLFDVRVPGDWPARLTSVALAIVLTLANTGCAGRFGIVQTNAGGAGHPAWFAPVDPSDRASLSRWRSAVGTPVVISRPAAASGARVTVVSWNTAAGEADVVGFVRALRETNGDAPLVLLLQEVYRRGAAVPRDLPTDAAWAGRLGGGTRARQDVETIAAATGLNLYYVPSMRNGALPSDEDRGNAILSSFALSELAAIELPFERQRRVAVAAAIGGYTNDGRPWKIRVVSAHLDNTMGPRRLWLAGAEYARARQARALVDQLADEPATILAGDFNTWFGFVDLAYRETQHAFPESQPTDRRATFRGVLRLDHMFYRLPAGWTAEYGRANDRFGSDHFPLIAALYIR